MIDEGNTIPFIARYRKEAHGALNDEILRNLDERLTYLRNLEEKKASVLASMEELGVLTDDLKKENGAGTDISVIEDLYRHIVQSAVQERQLQKKRLRAACK